MLFRAHRLNVSPAFSLAFRHLVDWVKELLGVISRISKPSVVLLCVIAAFGSNQCLAADTSRNEAVALLERCLEMQGKTDRYSARISVDREMTNQGKGWPRNQRAETFIRRDGDRLDIQQKYLFPKDSLAFRERSHRRRVITTKELCVLYIAAVDKPPPAKGVFSHDWRDWFNRHGVNSETAGGPLDGYFASTGPHRAAKLMAEADTLRLADRESLGGTDCAVVKAETKYGTFTLWIAETLGYLPLKTTYEIGPQDFDWYGDGRTFSQMLITAPDGTKLSGVVSTGVLEDVVIKQIGNAFVPVAGKFTSTRRYGDLDVVAANTYQRTEIQIDPHFDGTDAFVLDLPEGSVLTDEANKTAGVVYQWRRGNVVLGGAEFEGVPAVGSWQKNSVLTDPLCGILGVLLIGCSIKLSRSGSDSPESSRSKE